MTVTINRHGSIELLDLADSLVALGQDYRRWADKVGGDAPGTRLFIREIRSGSIIVDLLSMASAVSGQLEGASALAHEVKQIAAYSKDLAECLGFLKKGGDARPKNLDVPRAELISRAIEPIVNAPGGIIQISAGDSSTVNVTINSNEANAAQNRVRQLKREEAVPVARQVSEVLFYWFQVRDQEASRGVGDKGVIEAIDLKPAKVRFTDDILKAEMLKQALFQRMYVVDVQVDRIRGKVALYTILKLHEAIDR
jgi:hypothetical protein